MTCLSFTIKGAPADRVLRVQSQHLPLQSPVPFIVEVTGRPSEMAECEIWIVGPDEEAVRAGFARTTIRIPEDQTTSKVECQASMLLQKLGKYTAWLVLKGDGEPGGGSFTFNLAEYSVN